MACIRLAFCLVRRDSFFASSCSGVSAAGSEFSTSAPEAGAAVFWSSATVAGGMASAESEAVALLVSDSGHIQPLF
jgi:hypothetical protein